MVVHLLIDLLNLSKYIVTHFVLSSLRHQHVVVNEDVCPTGRAHGAIRGGHPGDALEQKVRVC